MRLPPISRRTGVVAATAATALLFAASPAAADVTVTPATAQQGAGVNLTYRVTNDHPKTAITKVRLVLPPASPVAEVYALSVPDWAPLTTNRALNPPLQSIHGGAPVTETTKDILWTASPGKQIPPGGSADLMVAMGPMPTSEKIEFTLQPTYADGSTGPALSPVAVALTAPAPAADPVAEDDFSDVLAAAEADESSSFFSYAGWFVAVLIGVVAVIAVLRSRRSAAPETADSAKPDSDVATDEGAQNDDDQPDDEPRARVTAWSYRDQS